MTSPTESSVGCTGTAAGLNTAGANVVGFPPNPKAVGGFKPEKTEEVELSLASPAAEVIDKVFAEA